MRRSYIFVGAILILTVFNFAPPNKVYACVCGYVDTPAEVEEARAEADAVFVGEVIKVSKISEVIGVSKDSGSSSMFPGSLATFKTLTVWKGLTSSEIIIKQLPIIDCSVDFQKGRSYVVYAGEDNDSSLFTSKCMGTTLVSDADIDVATLGQGQFINEAVQDQNIDQVSPLGHLIIPALAFLSLSLFAGLAFVLFRRRGRSTTS